MKVIDLYLAIERNKNVPKKVVYKYKTYSYYPEDKQYYREKYGDMISLFLEATCEDKVYLIEDTPKEDKKIEHINKVYDLTDFKKNYPVIAEMLKDLSNKQYEIIDRLNGE